MRCETEPNPNGDGAKTFDTETTGRRRVHAFGKPTTKKHRDETKTGRDFPNCTTTLAPGAFWESGRRRGASTATLSDSVGIMNKKSPKNKQQNIWTHCL